MSVRRFLAGGSESEGLEGKQKRTFASVFERFTLEGTHKGGRARGEE